MLVLNTSAMAKAIYSPQNVLEIKAIVIKGELAKVDSVLWAWSENPGLCGICRRQTALSISLPGSTVCQRGWKGGKTSHGSSRCQHSGICPFFFFHAHTHHLLFLICSSSPGYTLIFQSRDLCLLFLRSSTRLTVLTNPRCFHVSYFWAQ